jgi:hypothetical protein
MPDLVPASLNLHGEQLGAEQYEDPFLNAYRAASRCAEELANYPALQAGIWLYVDDLERSHTISQNIHTPEGSFWHGIMHRREGDFGNSKYWFRQAGTVPIRLEGYDPFLFVDEVAQRHGENPKELLDMQRREWAALFEHCAREAMQ